MAERLLNKVAVVTGAGSGIGRAIASRFLHEGAKVVLCGRGRDLLEEISGLAPARSLPVVCDVTGPAEVRAAAAAAARRFGGVDVLVAAAGIARLHTLAEPGSEAVDELFRVNVGGVVHTLREFAPQLNDGAAVLLITAAAQRLTMPALGAFLASKAALAAWIPALNAEFSSRSIRVNALAPGPTDTPLWDKLFPAGPSAALKDRIAGSTRTGRLGRAEDVAEAAVFLVSDAGRSIVGQVIEIGEPNN